MMTWSPYSRFHPSLQPLCRAAGPQSLRRDGHNASLPSLLLHRHRHHCHRLRHLIRIRGWERCLSGCGLSCWTCLPAPLPASAPVPSAPTGQWTTAGLAGCHWPILLSCPAPPRRCHTRWRRCVSSLQRSQMQSTASHVSNAFQRLPVPVGLSSAGRYAAQPLASWSLLSQQC